MWLLILLILEWYILIKLWNIWFLLIGLIYVLYIIDGAYLNGVRSWKHFRELKLWEKISPVNYYLPDGYDKVFGTENSDNHRYIFMVVPNMTNAPLIWGFGLHHGVFDEKLKIKYLLPKILFYLPVIRDVLMWSGAVGYDTETETDTIFELINSGNSVAYSCNGMSDFDDESEIRVKQPSNTLFEFIKHKNLSIVPVLVSGESEQYKIFRVESIQGYFHSKCNYPWPLLCFPTTIKKKKIHMQVLSPIHAHMYDSAEQMKQDFKLCIASANNNKIDKKLSFI